MTEAPRTRLEMPFLLMAGMLFSAFAGGVGLLAFVVQLVGGASLLSWFGDPAGPAILEKLHDGSLLALAFAAFIAAIAWGLWHEKPWTRLLMVGFWVLTLVSSAVLAIRGTPDWSSGCTQVFMLVLASAYLYGKSNVRAYYRALEARNPPPQPGRTPEGGAGGVA